MTTLRRLGQLLPPRALLIALAGLLLAAAGSAPGEARAAAPARAPALDHCATWAVYAGCESGTGCYDRALDLGAYEATVTGGLHSNSGLRDGTSSLSLSPPLAEWGPAGICTGNVCPPLGPAVLVPARPLPTLYWWQDFEPGGAWWNEMCQGPWAARCHRLAGPLGSGDVVSGGLWVVDGAISNAQFTPGDTAYTFVTLSDVAFTTGGVPAFQPFVGSSPRGGSRAFVYALGNVDIVASTVSWHGTIYAPNGHVLLGASGTLTGNGGVFAGRAEFATANLILAQSAAECPLGEHVLLPAVMLNAAGP